MNETPALRLEWRKAADFEAYEISNLEGAAGYKKLGKQFGVSWETARDIIKGRVWRHLLPDSA